MFLYIAEVNAYDSGRSVLRIDVVLLLHVPGGEEASMVSVEDHHEADRTGRTLQQVKEWSAGVLGTIIRIT